MAALRSPSRSALAAEYTSYEFTTSAGYDYNYDPSSSRLGNTNGGGFDPYADPPATPPSAPLPPLSSSPPLSSPESRFGGRLYAGSGRATPPPLAPDEPPLLPTAPSPEYIAETRKPSAPLSTPSAARKLLILDLNGTLVWRTPHNRRDNRRRWPQPQQQQHRGHNNHYQPPIDSHYAQPYPGPDSTDPYASFDPNTLRPVRTAHPRPYMPSFREYLFHPRTRTWLDTMVWSSAQPHSVYDMVERCFLGRREELVAVWARDTLGLEERDYNKKIQTTKDLSKPWDKLTLPLSSPIQPSSTSNPDTPQVHSAHTTLLLDDSPLKAHLQPWNHLCIREYSAALRTNDVQVRREEEELLRFLPPPPGPYLGNQTQGQEEGVGGKKRKRNKKKASALGVLPAPVGGGGGGGAQTQIQGSYDPTLLAVIGVLETIKWEGNVAGWMRAGGLRGFGAGSRRASPVSSRAATTVEEDELGEEEAREEDDGQSEGKRRRVSLEAEEGERGEREGEGEAGTREEEDGNIGDTGQWFEDEAALTYWVRAGRRALDELGVEVVAGVRV